MNRALFSALVNAPSVESMVAIFFQSIIDDERRAALQRAARERNKEQRTIRVFDASTSSVRWLVVSEIEFDVPANLQGRFKARLAGRLTTGQRASIYVSADGTSFGPLNIFK